MKFFLVGSGFDFEWMDFDVELILVVRSLLEDNWNEDSDEIDLTKGGVLIRGALVVKEDLGST